jgi:bifunctional DNA-binding transcriptional regulator/antitoxin component of YhaV-PrlF toxin-antitoxin module
MDTTRMSSKGQVIIPKAEAQGWTEGTELVIEDLVAVATVDAEDIACHALVMCRIDSAADTDAFHKLVLLLWYSDCSRGGLRRGVG